MGFLFSEQKQKLLFKSRFSLLEVSDWFFFFWLVFCSYGCEGNYTAWISYWYNWNLIAPPRKKDTQPTTLRRKLKMHAKHHARITNKVRSYFGSCENVNLTWRGWRKKYINLYTHTCVGARARVCALILKEENKNKWNLFKNKLKLTLLPLEKWCLFV